jgi:hypothetical protein
MDKWPTSPAVFNGWTSTKIFVPIENLTRSAGIFKDLLRTTQPMELFLMLILNQDGFGVY